MALSRIDITVGLLPLRVAWLGAWIGILALLPAPASALDFVIQPGQKLATICAHLDAARAGFCGTMRELYPQSRYRTEPLWATVRPDSTFSALEGLLAPGSYELSLEDPLAFYQALYAASVVHVQPLKDHRVDDGWSPYEMLILASVVEKESVDGRNRGQVADVFLNRLRRNMKLQSCPTVEYALGFHRPFLLTRDVQIPSPYNTYLHKGLPPTPVATVSPETIAAVLRPAGTDVIFLVFDWTRLDHAFASDLATHQANAAAARSNFEQVFGRKVMREKFAHIYYAPHADRAGAQPP